MVEIVVRKGPEAAAFFPDLARLRMTVFRAFPYLYEGDEAYERRYLETYSRSKDSVVILAMDGGDVVGCSTALPMADESAEFRQPFANAGMVLQTLFYFGESVLLPAYRGQGIGHAFFDAREAEARRQATFTHCCFAAVERPDDHPQRPPDYRPLHDFWHARGYRRQPTLVTTYRWKDIGDSEETDKPMAFWLKQIR